MNKSEMILNGKQIEAALLLRKINFQREPKVTIPEDMFIKAAKNNMIRADILRTENISYIGLQDDILPTDYATIVNLLNELSGLFMEVEETEAGFDKLYARAYEINMHMLAHSKLKEVVQ